MSTRTVRWCLGILLILSACSEVIVKTQLIVFAIDAQANLNHPIAVDLVLIYDQQLLAEIVKLSAHDWFTKRAQLKRDYPVSYFSRSGYDHSYFYIASFIEEHLRFHHQFLAPAT